MAKLNSKNNAISSKIAAVKGRTTLQEVLSDESVKKVFDIFGEHIRLVGGCVRDAFASEEMGKVSHETIMPESMDIDFATVLRPNEVQMLLAENGIEVKTNENGYRHGTIFATVDGLDIEVTTLRKDLGNNGGHDAEVAFIHDWNEDAERRDFTINALYADEYGSIFDKFGGVRDIQIGAVRFVGDADKRVEQDPVRILRFFRAWSEHGGFPLDKGEIFYAKSKVKDDYVLNALQDHEAALTACEKYADTIETLSKNRISEELCKLMGTKNPVQALRKMDEIGVIEHAAKPILYDAGYDYENGVKLDFDALERLITIEERTGFRSSKLARIMALTNDGNRAAVNKIFKVGKKDSGKLRDAYKGKITNSNFNAKWLLYHENHRQKPVEERGREKEKTLDLTLLSAAMGNLSKEQVDQMVDVIKTWEDPGEMPVTNEMVMKECGVTGCQISQKMLAVERVFANYPDLPVEILMKVSDTNGMN